MAALTDEQAALAALESNQLLRLRLRKRYYLEALSFHSAGRGGGQDDFRAAWVHAQDRTHEYQLDSAKVSLETLSFD